MASFNVIDRSGWKYALDGGNAGGDFAADNGYNKITIQATGATGFTDYTGGEKIEGVLLKPLDFSFDADYGTMSDIYLPIVDEVANSINSVVGKMTGLANGGEAGAVYNSKKIWKKSGYLNLNVEIRLINFEKDKLSPLAQAAKITRLVLPVNKYQTNSMGQAFVDLSFNATKFIGKVAKVGADTIASGVTAVGFQAGGDVDKGIRGLGDAIAEIGSKVTSAGGIFQAEDLFALKDAPPSVSVTWGKKMFSHKDMIVEKVSFTPSKEIYVTDDGEYSPIYIDANITLSSRTILRDVGEIGFGNSVAGNRVIDGPAPTKNETAPNNYVEKVSSNEGQTTGVVGELKSNSSIGTDSWPTGK